MSFWAVMVSFVCFKVTDYTGNDVIRDNIILPYFYIGGKWLYDCTVTSKWCLISFNVFITHDAISTSFLVASKCNSYFFLILWPFSLTRYIYILFTLPIKDDNKLDVSCDISVVFIDTSLISEILYIHGQK